jgi:hypothetical protein
MLRRTVAQPPLPASAATAIALAILARHSSTSSSDNDFQVLSEHMKEQPKSSHPDAASRGAPMEQQVDPWAVPREVRDYLSERDPLGGQFHKDYIRDPTLGHTPQFAPRNFAEGGRHSYHHPVAGGHAYELSFAEREAQRHDAERLRAELASRRQMLVEGVVAPAELADQIPPAGARSDRSTGSLMPRDMFDQLSAAPGRLSHIPSPRPASARLPGAGIAPEELFDASADRNRAIHDSALEEGLLQAYGLRDKERSDYSYFHRSRKAFRGFDMDRFLAANQGTLPNMQQLKPLVAPSSAVEAMKNVRDGSVPTRESTIGKVLALNTVSNNPLTGEDLTQHVVESVRSVQASQRHDEEKQRRARLGLGRQGPLVTESGPDKRKVQRNKNDERLLNALQFQYGAYRKTFTDDHYNPYERNQTKFGVGHLLRTRFDIDRRTHRIAKGEADLTERATAHLGKPVQQQLDEYVKSNMNSRGDRPIEYFRPFPTFRDMRLFYMYRDTEGFPFIRQRPEYLEWELFVRYRAHHEQRVELALQHGLEPKANETHAERAARQEQLDELCEATVFNAASPSLRRDTEALDVGVGTLRAHFGAYVVPSPTIVEQVLQHTTTHGLALVLRPDEHGTIDTREHLLSARYLNRLQGEESFLSRTNRNFVKELQGKVPEPVIEYTLPSDVLKHFTADELAMYRSYVQTMTNKHLKKHEEHKKGRRWIAEHNQFGSLNSVAKSVEVVDCTRSDGQTVVLPWAIVSTRRAGESDIFSLDDTTYTIIKGTQRKMETVAVQLEDAQSVVNMQLSDFMSRTEEIEGMDPNPALTYGVRRYWYNRANYVDTQDAIWAERVASGDEGWSPATHADGLRAGLPVRARRAGRPGSDYHRAVIVEYLQQPFFNPDPRTVTVQFAENDTIEEVPLSDLLIWQKQYYGPERTIGDQSRRPPGFDRFVDVTDPMNENARVKPHFLDKYAVKVANIFDPSKFRTHRSVFEIDKWNKHDRARPENHRPLSISHRKDYVRGHYHHRYTPWEWIAMQEGDQPLIAEQIRRDDVGPSHFFSPNRYWRFKRRPHGYIQNFPNEVRDMLQYVDGVTPWAKAQKIRTHWEVREHHPVPVFNRPELAPHRNVQGLMPSQLWDVDKKSGRVKAVKDTVRDYQTRTPYPKWVQM